MEGVRVIRAPASPFRSLHSESLRKRTLSCVNINIISVNNSLIVGTNNRLFLHYTGFRAPACGLNCSVMFDYLRPLGLKPTSLLCLRDFPGKSTGEGCHFLLQGIFPTQGSNLCLLHWPAEFFFFATEPPGKPLPTRFLVYFKGCKSGTIRWKRDREQDVWEGPKSPHPLCSHALLKPPQFTKLEALQNPAFRLFIEASLHGDD